MSRALSLAGGALSVFLAVVLHATTAAAQEVPDPEASTPDAAPPANLAPPPDAIVPAAAAPTPRRAPSPLGFRFDAGYRVERFASLAAPGVDLGAAFGGRPTKHLAWWVTPRFGRGATDNGLDVTTIRFGGEVEAVFDPIRFGIGLGLLHMDVDRATHSGAIGAFGAEGRLFVQADLVPWDTGSLFLRGTVGAELVGKVSVFAPGIALGIELDVRGTHPR